MGIQIELNKGRVPVKVWTRDIEPEAIRQMLNMASLPLVHGHIAAMPDVHAGIGATAGSVIPTRRVISPAPVGVDIGCGMNAVPTSLGAGDLPDSLRALRLAIESAVPAGFNWHAAGRNVLGRYAAAQKDMRRHQIHLSDRDLAYFSEGSELFDDYVEEVEWAQDYALLNLSRMMAAIVEASKPVLPPHLPTLRLEEDEAINCHHNYVAREEHFGERVFLTRKAAISARAGELGIIPGSMGARSYIVRGLGNAESFCSCSHGAGRRMSRTRTSIR